MRILVCGARGFVGAEVCRQLVSADHEVVATDVRSDPGRLGDLASKLEWHVGDCSNTEFMLNTIGRRQVDAIYYGPFYRAGAGLVKNQNVEFGVMGAGALRAFNLTLALDVRRIVFPSSTAVHGPQQRGSPPVDEGSQISPNGVYGATKLLVEEWAKSLNAGLKANVALCLRLPSIYGPGADIGSRRANVFAVQAARGGVGDVLYTEDTPVCLAHTADTAAAIVAMLEADQANHTVYELGGITATFRQIADVVAARIPAAAFRYGEETLSPLPSSVVWRRAAEEFGIDHQSLEDGMGSILTYEAEKLARGPTP